MTANDILESLDELDLVSNNDILARIIYDCSPLDRTDTYEDAEEDSIKAYCSSLVHLLLSSTPLGRITNNNTSLTINSHELDGNYEYTGADWMNYMGRSIREHGLIPRDFYINFMDSYRTLRTLTPPMFPRSHQQPWEMHEKAKLLPMIHIPCIPDQKTLPFSLISQDQLQLHNTNIKQIVELGHAFHADAFFDMKDIKSLPSLALKTIRYLPRIDQCDGTVPQYTDDDDYFFSDLLSSTSINSDICDNKITDIDTLDSPFKKDATLQLAPMTLVPSPSPRKEDIFSQHTLTIPPPPYADHVLIIPEKRTLSEYRQQREKGPPIKEGASGYWPKSCKQKPESPPTTPKLSSIVSLSNSLFSNHRSAESDPIQHSSPEEEPSGDQSYQGSQQRDILSMKSLSIDDEFDHNPSEHGSQKTQKDFSHHRSQQDPPSSHNTVTTTKIDKHNHHSLTAVKEPTFRNNVMPPQGPRLAIKGKQKAFSSAAPPIVFSAEHNLRDFMANRQTQPVSSSSLIGSSKMKRAWCDLDDPYFPAAKKKEEWKLTGAKKM